MRPMKFLTDSLAYTPAADSAPAGFWPLSALPLVIIVGLTGVGKSTVVELLPPELDFILLPNRRTIADAIIIAALQAEAGVSPHPVTDRLKRFEYTARYREKFPGGMAHAVSQLSVRAKAGRLVIFDGLRGLDEVTHAGHYFPDARFVVLDAPDMVRLTRLLTRGDAFDQVKIRQTPADQNVIAALRGMRGIDAVFSEDDLTQLARLAQAGGWPVDEVVKKTSVIVEERRNYDSQAAQRYLTQTLPPAQVLVIDTARHPAPEVAAQVSTWLQKTGSRKSRVSAD